MITISCVYFHNNHHILVGKTWDGKPGTHRPYYHYFGRFLMIPFPPLTTPLRHISNSKHSNRYFKFSTYQINHVKLYIYSTKRDLVIISWISFSSLYAFSIMNSVYQFKEMRIPGQSIIFRHFATSVGSGSTTFFNGRWYLCFLLKHACYYRTAMSQSFVST